MADITKIQPIGSSTQYELGARYLTTGRTFQIKDNDATNSGPVSSTFNGTANLVINLPSTIKASLTGNASTASKLATARTISLTGSVTGSASFDGSGNISIATTVNHNHNSSYILKGGDTVNGTLTMSGEYVFQGKQPRKKAGSGGWAYTPFRVLDNAGTDFAHFGVYGTANTMTYIYIGANDYNSANNLKIAPNGNITANYLTVTAQSTASEGGEICLKADPNNGYDACMDVCSGNWRIHSHGIECCRVRLSTGGLFGAVWNDYAEMRNVPEANEYDETKKRNIKLAGRCVREVGDDTMALSTERMQPGCKIISDTFGFNIGETDDCKTPIAVSGRALVYIYEGREAARQHIGQPVCSGPDGTVSIMTDEEYTAKGYCCVGTISAVPEYEIWGSGNISVDGRIWIYVR